MLKSIRQALLQKREHPYPQFEDASVPEDIGEKDSLEVLFAERFIELGGHFIYCESSLQLAEHLLSYIEHNEVSGICALERDVQEFLKHYGFPFSSDPAAFWNAGITISTCQALIAKEGALLLHASTASGRSSSVYSNAYVVFARTSQLVDTFASAMDMVQQAQATTNQHLPEANEAHTPSSWTILTPQPAMKPAASEPQAESDAESDVCSGDPEDPVIMGADEEGDSPDIHPTPTASVSPKATQPVKKLVVFLLEDY